MLKIIKSVCNMCVVLKALPLFNTSLPFTLYVRAFLMFFPANKTWSQEFPAGRHLYCCSVVVHTKGGGGEQWSPTGQTPGTSCYQSIKFVQKYFTTSLFL